MISASPAPLPAPGVFAAELVVLGQDNVPRVEPDERLEPATESGRSSCRPKHGPGVEFEDDRKTDENRDWSKGNGTRGGERTCMGTGSCIGESSDDSVVLDRRVGRVTELVGERMKSVSSKLPLAYRRWS